MTHLYHSATLHGTPRGGILIVILVSITILTLAVILLLLLVLLLTTIMMIIILIITMMIMLRSIPILSNRSVNSCIRRLMSAVALRGKTNKTIIRPLFTLRIVRPRIFESQNSEITALRN